MLTHTPDRSPEFRWRRGVCLPLADTNVVNSRPPACDQPLYANGGRVAHRTDNSDTALPSGTTPETGRGQGFNPAPSRPRTIRAGSGKPPRVGIPKYPHGYSTEEKDLASGRRRTRTVDTVRSGDRDNRAELSPAWTDRLITWVLITHYKPLT